MATAILPMDIKEQGVGRGGMALIHYVFDYHHWEFRLETGIDVGRDCVFEHIENNEWHNGTIRCQVKGTEKPGTYLLASGNEFSYKFEKKTINYALRSRDAFLVFLCDLVNEKVYYLPIQEYFIENPKEYERLENDNDTMKLRIPLSNQITRENDQAVVQLSKIAYAFINNRVRKIETTG